MFIVRVMEEMEDVTIFASCSIEIVFCNFFFFFPNNYIFSGDFKMILKFFN